MTAADGHGPGGSVGSAHADLVADFLPRARVTFPATRIVWPSVPRRSGSELIEIADSPNPGRYSMLNCPG